MLNLVFNYLIKYLFQVVYWVFSFLFMLMIHFNVIDVDVQNVSYIFIYLIVGIFSIKPFN